MKGMFLISFFLCLSISAFAQMVYKTPSGEKYHTATWRYVKNVSESMSVEQAKKRGLSPCSQCKPSSGSNASTKSNGSLGIKSGEAKGANAVSTQCKGTTKAGARCKHRTKMSMVIAINMNPINCLKLFGSPWFS